MLKTTRILLWTTGLIMMIVGCSNPFTSDDQNGGESDWLIPENQVQGGGPGKDGIPALNSPQLIRSDEATYLTGSELVIAIKSGDNIHVHPHQILDWHEIVNHTVYREKYALTYCPLTGSGIAWNRELDGISTTFGVSGLLYKSNLIPYDRETDSNWSQMQLRSVNGSLKGTTAETFFVLETTWGFIKQHFPQARVLSQLTGHSRPYGTYPYGQYKTNNQLLFNVSPEDTRLHRKERIHGIIVDEATLVFRFDHFDNPMEIINTEFNGEEIVAIGSESQNFIVSFKRNLADGTVLTFSASNRDLPVIAMDNEGNQWNIFGEAVDGPRTGTRLTPTKSYMAYWFAWGAFWPGATIYE